MSDDRDDNPELDPRAPADTETRVRLRRREALHAKRRKRRRWGSVGAVVLLAVVAIAASTSGGSSRSQGDAGGGESKKHVAGGASVGTSTRPEVLPGGPLAPPPLGGLAALWAPQNVVGTQPGTAAAYEAASARSGLPGYLLIADRGNNRILVVNPQAGRVPLSHGRRPRGRAAARSTTTTRSSSRAAQALIANEEDNHAIVQSATRRPQPAACCSAIPAKPARTARTYTPPTTPTCCPTAPSPSPTPTTAASCSFAAHRIVRQYGHSGVCRHEPPRYLGAVNGDTPAPGRRRARERDQRQLDRRDRPRRQAACSPCRRRSAIPPTRSRCRAGGSCSPTTRPRPCADHRPSRPRALALRPGAGYGRLDHPSLAMALPNGDIAVNDDYRDRVVVIDPRTNRIVWQYGHTDAPGTAPGYLNIPDGMDFVPAGPAAGPTTPPWCIPRDGLAYLEDTHSPRYSGRSSRRSAGVAGAADAAWCARATGSSP